jgi:hypothetical protein
VNILGTQIEILCSEKAVWKCKVETSFGTPRALSPSQRINYNNKKKTYFKFVVVKIRIKCVTKAKRNSYGHVVADKSTSRVTVPYVIAHAQCADAQN